VFIVFTDSTNVFLLAYSRDASPNPLIADDLRLARIVGKPLLGRAKFLLSRRLSFYLLRRLGGSLALPQRILAGWVANFCT
jgi:hypothetical protein